MPEPGLKITPEMRTAIVEDADRQRPRPCRPHQGGGRRPPVDRGRPQRLSALDRPHPRTRHRRADGRVRALSRVFIRMSLDINVSSRRRCLSFRTGFAAHSDLPDDPDLLAGMNPQALEPCGDPEAGAGAYADAGDPRGHSPPAPARRRPSGDPAFRAMEAGPTADPVLLDANPVMTGGESVRPGGTATAAAGASSPDLTTSLYLARTRGHNSTPSSRRLRISHVFH